MNKIVFINGYPGTGKTSLVNVLRKSGLKCPIISKDELKEVLFGNLSLTTKDNGRQLNSAVIAIMLQLLVEAVRTETPLVLEANFKPLYDQEAFDAALSGCEVEILQILLTAPVEVLLSRDKARWISGERNQGHEPLSEETVYETQINVVKHFEFNNSTNITLNSTEINDNYYQLATEIIEFIGS